MKMLKMSICGLMILLVGGCAQFGGRRGAEIQNVENCPVTIVGEQPMKEIVMRAAHQKQWVPQAIEDGTVRCTLNLRAHQVVVDVIYTESTFSIRYVSSENMNYDETLNTINPKYNQWVRNLQREIVGQGLKR